MMQLAKRVARLSESQTIQMAKKSRSLQEAGHDIISLSLGEPDFETPEHICKGAKKAIDEGWTHYPPVAGYPELKQAIVKKLKRDNGLAYSPDQVVVSAGAKHSLANVMLATLNPGDEVLIPAPYWVSYPEMVKLAGGKPVVLPTHIENKFKVTPEQVEEAISEKTRLFLFSSPSNPTGTVYSQDELEALSNVFADHPEVMIISDEIYEYINFEGEHQSITQFKEVIDQTIVINGVSKAFAMTGWRIGYLAAPEPVAKAVEKIQGQTTSGACSIAQKAAETALFSDLSATHRMCEAFRKRRDLVLEHLKNVRGIKTYVPEGAFYLFPDISEFLNKSVGDKQIKDSSDFCMYLLNEAQVGLVPGSAFGNDDCVRLSFAASEDRLSQAMHRLKEGVQNIR